MTHIMVDLETWGTKPGAALRSIGAVVFDPTKGALGDTFYSNIDDASCEAVGLHRDASTISWWGCQHADAQKALLTDPYPLPAVLAQFTAWWNQVGGINIWGHGAGFDPVLLEAAYEACLSEAPWKFWNIRCCRTVLACANLRPQKAGRGDLAHFALDDAVRQAKAVCIAFNRLKLAAD